MSAQPLTLLGPATGSILNLPPLTFPLTHEKTELTMTAQPHTSDPSHAFSADVSRLLDIVANALYSNRDVFLRELISNAADACDRLRYDAIQTPSLIQDNPKFRIHVYADAQANTLTLVDNGIGMTRDELIDHLGTIAKSGTGALMDQLSTAKNDGADPLKLIGQFGVGFYACYMVATHVTVTSRRAGDDELFTWSSDGRTGFEVTQASAEEAQKLDGDRGTAITLHLKPEDETAFLQNDTLRSTIVQYSDHVDVQIFLNTPDDTAEGEGAPVNRANAIWARPKSEISSEQYTEFYRHITHGFDEPVLTAHWHAEGTMAYSALLFIPTMRPWDLYDPARQGTVKLYVRRVFISDSMDDLMYPWLRFVKGVIDSEDLPLNISRENLQHNPILHKIRTGVTNRVLKDLAKLAQSDKAAFHAFWGQFGAALKEGLYDADAHRADIFKLCRFFSSHDQAAALTSLDDYIGRMKDGQEDIYYISGETVDALQHSPHLEGFKARGFEVLFFTDTIDEFWLQHGPAYEGKRFKSVTQGDIDLSAHKDEQASDGKDEDARLNDHEHDSAAFENLLIQFKDVLSNQISDVRLSKRLTDSPVCLVAPSDAPDMHMERVLKIQQNYTAQHKPILELNPTHLLIKKLQTAPQDAVSDAAELLLDQARIIQGEPVKNPASFSRKMSRLMAQSL